MKKLILIPIFILIYFQVGTTVNSNPWIEVEHISQNDGYVHDFPCHNSEIAVITEYDQSGCYLKGYTVDGFINPFN